MSRSALIGRRRRWVVLLLVCVGGAGVVFALGGAGVASTGAYATSGLPPLPVIAARVERLRGLTYNRLPRVVLITEHQFHVRGYAAAGLSATTARPRRVPPAARFALEEEQLLGAMPAGLEPRAVKAVGPDLLGFYDPESGRVVLVLHRGETEPELEDVLAHEMLHALEFQTFGVRRDLWQRDQTQIRAFDAVVEGSAVFGQYL